MGNPIFGVDIAGIVNDVIGEGVFDATITRYTRGARAAGNLTGGRAATAATVDCKGFWEDFTGTPPPGVELELNDRKAILIGDSVPAGGLPRVNDQITIHEPIGDSSLFMVKLLSRDPAAAVYTYLCRDRVGPDGA